MFIIAGPGSPSVLTNVLHAIEQHVEWISDCLAYAKDHGIIRIEATESAEEAWTEDVNEAAAGTLYSHANSWYIGANIPGKPRVLAAYAGGLPAYRQRCEAVAANDYEGFALLTTEQVSTPVVGAT